MSTLASEPFAIARRGHFHLAEGALQPLLRHSVARVVACPLGDLLHGEERRVYGDSAYASQKELIGEHAPKAKDFTNLRARKGG